MITKKCFNCGKEFTPRQYNQLYCCHSCAKHANYLKEKNNKPQIESKFCIICGKEFIPRTKSQILCGDENCKKQQSKNRSKTFRNRETNSFFIKKCIICGSEFTTNNNQQILCNKEECRKERAYREKKQISESEYASLIGVYNYSTKGNINVCPICKKEFVTNVWNQKYCCEECKDMAEILKRPANLTLNRICCVCGKKYLPKSSSQKVCSDECKKALDKERNKRYNDKKPKKQYEPIKCKYCNEYFTPKKCSQIFCCKEHQEKYYKDTNYKSIKDKEYYQKNKEVIQKKHSEYYFSNKEKVLERGRKNRAIRQATDPDYVLKKRIREQIRDHLKRNLLKKNFYTFDTLGYTVEDLHNRLESLFEQNSLPNKEKLSWDNMGTLWHIDHIKPCASFVFVNEDGMVDTNAIKECWALENLQPMYSEDNVSKSSWFNGEFYQKGKPI